MISVLPDDFEGHRTMFTVHTPALETKYLLGTQPEQMDSTLPSL